MSNIDGGVGTGEQENLTVFQSNVKVGLRPSFTQGSNSGPTPKRLHPTPCTPVTLLSHQLSQTGLDNTYRKTLDFADSPKRSPGLSVRQYNFASGRNRVHARALFQEKESSQTQKLKRNLPESQRDLMSPFKLPPPVELAADTIPEVSNAYSRRMSLQNSNAVCEKTSSSTYPLEKDIVSHSALDRELAGADSVKRRKCIFAGEDGDVTTDPSPALSFQMARMGSFSCGTYRGQGQGPQRSPPQRSLSHNDMFSRESARGLEDLDTMIEEVSLMAIEDLRMNLAVSSFQIQLSLRTVVESLPFDGKQLPKATGIARSFSAGAGSLDGFPPADTSCVGGCPSLDALNTLMDTQGFALPAEAVNGTSTVSCETVKRLLRGELREKIDKFLIIDCRYDYEFRGGHIKGAVNICERKTIELFFIANCHSHATHATSTAAPSLPQKVAIIFHCEYSQRRAPCAWKFIRQLDRELATKHNHWTLCMPDIYVMEGGFKKFVDTSGHDDLMRTCEGNAPNKNFYVSMWDPAFKLDLKKSEANWKRSWERKKHQSRSNRYCVQRNWESNRQPVHRVMSLLHDVIPH